jgi:hypothetical protein
MDDAEKKFWVVVTLYGGVALAIFSTGLFALNDEHYAFGGVLTVAGLGGGGRRGASRNRSWPERPDPELCPIGSANSDVGVPRL